MAKFSNGQMAEWRKGRIVVLLKVLRALVLAAFIFAFTACPFAGGHGFFTPLLTGGALVMTLGESWGDVRSPRSWVLLVFLGASWMGAAIVVATCARGLAAYRPVLYLGLMLMSICVGVTGFILAEWNPFTAITTVVWALIAAGFGGCWVLASRNGVNA